MSISGLYRVVGLIAPLALVALGPWLTSAGAAEFEVRPKEKVLDNGLKVLVLERRAEPSATCWLFYKVGSVNERPGITGLSHLFEHLMFKGTRIVGVKDPVADRKIMADMDALYLRLAEERARIPAEDRAVIEQATQTANALRRAVEDGRKGVETGVFRGQKIPPEMMGLARAQLARGEQELQKAEARLEEVRNSPAWGKMGAVHDLEKEWNALREQEKANIVKDELWETYLRHGGTALNAFTSQDTTVYIVTLPANKVELFMWLESDRMANAVFREFYSERDVVKEERRLTENRPLGFYNESMDAIFFDAHPYSWPVLGWMSDLDAITRQDAEEYFAIHYAPNNAVAVIVGDVDAEQVFALAAKHFGGIPRGRKPPPAVPTVEPTQKGHKRFYHQAETQPRVDFKFHTPAAGHKDLPPLILLGDLLSGKTGRLRKALVEGKEMALSVSAVAGRPSRFPQAFEVGATVKGDIAPEDVEKEVWTILEEMKNAPPTDRDLQKVKNQNEAMFIRGLRSNQGLTAQLGWSEVVYKWQYLNELPRQVRAVAGADVQRVARHYFTRDNCLVGIVTKKDKAAEAKK
ncbi:MAG: insulinase family protein [Planctomycetes bacterium]|nr:insulinase family protein [Planctomycetota bacterium]